MIEIPLGLKSAIESGNCVLFIGAGIGDHLLDKDGDPIPNAATLAEYLIDEFKLDIEYTNDLAKIATYVDIKKGRKELEAYLGKILSDTTPDEYFRWLFTRKWRAIFTTNYDNGIEQAYEKLSSPPQKPITITSTSDLVPFDPRFEVPIYHLHGTLFNTAKPNIIITDDDYAKYSERRRMLFEILKGEFATSTFLYIGYSNRDPNWKKLLAELTEEFYPSKLPNSYRIDPFTDQIDIEILKSKGIETISATYKEFYEAAVISISGEVLERDKIQEIKEGIPSDLVPFFEKNIAAMARLLSGWTYVNQAPFNEKSNLSSFLTGDRPNWALIEKEQFFERDIQLDLYNELLDYATNTVPHAVAITILGSAGYGVSTLLMSLAVRIVKEQAGKVFMLKPGQDLIEGDIEFASSLFQNPTFFFIDNASDYSGKISNAIQTIKEKNKSAMFVLGEHTNEWHQSQKKPFSKEFIIEPLSDPEIHRLLDYLEKNSQLNVLESLSRERQFSVIKEKHKKELLVAMREATEGKSFDAILEEEFRGITDEVSRQLYTTVCCFYQHGAYVRDDLLARLINIPLSEIYDRTANATEGIVFYECINESKEIYGARARHRVIASIVWERCIGDMERGAIIQNSLESLNLNYGSDKSAFEAFTRSDRFVDSIGTLDGKIRFFEAAAKKDPDSPYVRQHYSRMLLRENKFNLALAQIESGIAINQSAKVLVHTKGLILMELALTSDSNELARRYMAQSEACFRQCISSTIKDDYGYQSLAELYRRWAKRATAQDEVITYIAKAEEIISEGLRNARVRDGLWIESAKIQEWLGNEPSFVKALSSAVRDAPGSIIARYLLGRAYRKAQKYKEALDILEPNIKNHTDEFRSFVEYAIALSYHTKSYREAINTLRISDLYGLGDPRYIATLGGMLFMDRNFTQANEIFSQSLKRNFTGNEINSIQYKPANFENLEKTLILIGKVVDVQAGHAFIEVPGYPNFLCPGSKYSGIIMRKGLKISFEPAFRPKGSIADQPKLAE
ncbi:MAG: SIR2 family protein [Chloroflexi bacterium]|nr:SIR2 family protein [Chloroflexota bacterium]